MSEARPPEDRPPKRRRPWKGDDPFRDDLEEQEDMEYHVEEATPVTPEEDEEGPRGHKTPEEVYEDYLRREERKEKGELDD